MKSRRSAYEEMIADALRVFRQAIPEIAEDAEILFIRENPWKSPDGDITLERYEVPGPWESRYHFVIAYLPEKNLVIARRFPPEELPKDVIGEFYIVIQGPP